MSSEFINYIKNMSSTARATISKKGLPLDVREEVMDLTPFTKKNSEVIVVPLVTLVKILSSTRFIVRVGSFSGKELKEYNSWLFEITQGFIDLLKYTPHLPPILDLFKQVLREFKMQQQQHSREMYDRIDRMIEQFIIKNRLQIHDTLAEEIKSFFHGVIHKRDEFLRVNGVENDRESRMLVNMSIEYIFSILEQLYILNQNEYYHEMIQHIYLEDEMENFKKNPRIYDEIDTFDFENSLLEAEQLREMQEHGQGGKRKKKMRSSTRNSYKKRKRTYKKRSYRKPKNVKKM
jgi:hypothetical protein